MAANIRPIGIDNEGRQRPYQEEDIIAGTEDPGGIISTTPAARTIAMLTDFTGTATFLAAEVPGNTLATNGDTLEFFASGTTGATGDTVRLSFGGTTIFEHGVGTSRAWIVQGLLVRNTSSSFNSWAFSVETGATGDADQASGSAVLTSNQNFVADYSTSNDADRNIQILRVKYAPIGQTGAAAPPLLQNLEGYWKCETASLLLDSSGNSRHFQAVSVGPASIAGIVGNAYDCQGGSGSANRPSSDAVFNFAGDFSVQLWARPRGPGNATVFGKGGNNIGAEVWDIWYNSNNNRMEWRAAGKASIIAGSNPWSSPSWQHYIIVRSGSTATAYTNGSAVGSATWSGTLTGAQVLSASFHQMDEMAIWSRALTTAEIAELYSNGAGKAIV